MWSRLNEVQADVDYEALQEQFAMLNNAKSGTTQSQRASAAGSSASGTALLRRAPVVTLLAMQRSNNIGVLLANLKMPPAQVRGLVGLSALGNGGSPQATQYNQ